MRRTECTDITARKEQAHTFIPCSGTSLTTKNVQTGTGSWTLHGILQELTEALKEAWLRFLKSSSEIW